MTRLTDLSHAELLGRCATLESDVRAITHLLQSREWADHVAVSHLGQALADQVAELVGRAAHVPKLVEGDVRAQGGVKPQPASNKPKAAPPPRPKAQSLPPHLMLAEKAEGLTFADFMGAYWTVDQLVELGYLVPRPACPSGGSLFGGRAMCGDVVGGKYCGKAGACPHGVRS